MKIFKMIISSILTRLITTVICETTALSTRLSFHLHVEGITAIYSLSDIFRIWSSLSYTMPMKI